MKYITIISSVILLFLATFVAHPNAVFALEPEAGSAAKLNFGQMLRDERVEKLRDYLTMHNSPLTAEASHFITEADRLELDWKLVAAIAGVESTFGKHTPPGSYNGWGWGIPTGAQSGIAFDSWKQGITTVSEGLKFRYINRGATSIEQIGRIYAASPRWSGSVRFFLNQIEEFTPADPTLLAVTL